MVILGYSLVLIVLTIFSYGFVDGNFPYKTSPFLYDLIHFHRGTTTLLYSIVVILLFGVYGWVLWRVRKKKFNDREVWQLISLTVAILFFSFPAFSYDIFNYIATAKATFFYQENPYIVMPIEIPNEPMLKFTHAANKIALYGPVWIFLTAIPHILGLGNIFLTVFTFKTFILLFYLGLSWLIWKLSNKNVWSLAFFALNPLVIVETLVSAHNDVLMMFFTLLSFYLLKKKKFMLSFIFLLLSVFIKFATVFLLPVYGYLLYRNFKREKADWQKIWKWSAILMFLIFFLSPLREELYPWYLIWPLTFIALRRETDFVFPISVALSFGLMFRLAPFLFTGSWSGVTLVIKKVVSFLPPFLVFILIYFKKRSKKFLFTAFLLLTLFLRLSLLTQPLEKLFERDYNYKNFENLYYGSQYVLEKPSGIIPDNAVYSFAAGYYLRGGSPILVDPSQPPLGKYFLAFSIFLFQNTKIATYLFFYLTILAFFLLANYLFRSPNLALIVTFIFTFEKNFINQLKYAPLLDIFQLCFIIFAFYFFIKWVENKAKGYLLLASLGLACIVAVKFFITGLVIFISWVIFLSLRRQWKKILYLSLSVGFTTYLILTASYLRVLLAEPNPLKVIGIQKWIFLYHQSKLTSIFTIWPLIYFNRWQTWWGDFTVIQDPQWWFVWPVLFTFSFIVLLLYAIRKKWKDEKLEIILIWFLVYSLFISFAQASIRYLIPVLPFLYLIFFKGLILAWHEIKNKKI